jgi:hypothetical protein
MVERIVVLKNTFGLSLPRYASHFRNRACLRVELFGTAAATSYASHMALSAEVQRKMISLACTKPPFI